MCTAAGVEEGNRKEWVTSSAPKDPLSGYHIHFRSNVTPKRVRVTVDYVAGSIKRRPDEREPWAESFMEWLAQFFRKEVNKAVVHASFGNPHERWRSRFNLPFKVTMSGLDVEVVIDGISLRLQENPTGATEGWLRRSEDKLWAAINLERELNVKQFRLDEELNAAYSAVHTFVEDLQK